MSITLKAVKIHQDMSEETLCFSASLYWNGKKVGRVNNGGHGGGNNYSYDIPKIRKEITKWIESEPVFWSDGTECDFEKLDCLIGQLVEEADQKKWLKNQMRNKVLFRLEGDDEESMRTFKLKPHTRERIHKHIFDTYDNVVWVDGKVIA
jgi:hypothetical protein